MQTEYLLKLGWDKILIREYNVLQPVVIRNRNCVTKYYFH